MAGNSAEEEKLEKEIAVAKVTKKSAVRKLLKIYREAMKQKKYVAALKALELSLRVCGVYEPGLTLRGDSEHPIHLMADAPPQPQTIAEWEAQVLEAQRQREKRKLAMQDNDHENDLSNVAERKLESESKEMSCSYCGSENRSEKHKSTQKNGHSPKKLLPLCKNE